MTQQFQPSFQAMLGSEAFVEKMRPLLEGVRELKEIPRPQRLLHRPGLTGMFTKAVQGDKVLRDETTEGVSGLWV